MKKGVGMSLEVMVAAALAIIVLIVLVLLFSGKIAPFEKQSKDCSTMGGVCVEAQDCGVFAKTPYECSDKNKICCINYCIKDGGSCLDPCIESTEMKCNGNCPETMKQKYSAGCPQGRVCCG